MRRWYLVFSLAPAMLPPDRWFASDKLQHFFSSAFVQSMSYGSLRTVGVSHGASLAGATAASVTVGVAKEVQDSRARGAFSYRDLVWDAAGAGAATVLLVRTQR